MTSIATLTEGLRDMPMFQPTAEGEPQTSRRQLRILLVDDDLMVLYPLRNILEEDGHLVTTAASGQEAVDIFAEALARGTPVSVVITDLAMPDVGGRKVAALIKALSPRTPVILLTGWGDHLLAEQAVPPCVDRMLSKPPHLGELRAALTALVSSGT
jgi:CheY-like chemotaxis protein